MVNLTTLMGSSIDPTLDVLSNGHEFESSQEHLPKAKSCEYHGIPN